MTPALSVSRMVCSRARAFELGHAALHLLARLGQLRRHVGEGAREAAQLVARGEHRLGGEVALRHLAHAVGQQQQRPRQLRAQQDRQQHRAEDGEDERQRQRAQVHAAQAVARQRPLLVLGVGVLHRQRVGRQRARQRLHEQQEAVLLGRDRQRAAGHARQRPHPRADAAGGGQRLLVEAFDLAGHADLAGLAQQRGAGALGRAAAGAAAGTDEQLAAAADERQLGHAALLAQPLEPERRRRRAAVADALGGQPRLARKVGHQGVEGALAQRQAGIQRLRQPHVEPGLDAARHELVGHSVDREARQQPDQREDAGQLDQQPAAELAAAQPQHQAHRGKADHQREQRGDGDVGPEQPDEAALARGAAAAAVEAHAHDEAEHQHEAGERGQRDDPGPARRARHRLGPIRRAACARRPARTRWRRAGRSTSGRAAARCPAARRNPACSGSPGRAARARPAATARPA